MQNPVVQAQMLSVVQEAPLAYDGTTFEGLRRTKSGPGVRQDIDAGSYHQRPFLVPTCILMSFGTARGTICTPSECLTKRIWLGMFPYSFAQRVLLWQQAGCVQGSRFRGAASILAGPFAAELAILAAFASKITQTVLAIRFANRAVCVFRLFRSAQSSPRPHLPASSRATSRSPMNGHP